MNAASTRLPLPPVVPRRLGSPDWIGDMPLSSYLELDAVPDSAARARKHLAKTLTEWDLGQLREPAVLVLSELVANSIVATIEACPSGDRPRVRLWLRGDAERVLLIVWDAVLREPRPREAGEDDESGRGLAIVAALSKEWGHYLPVIPLGGKVTWALISDP
jgi:anti-sigma regulatory factor (Ser/Thr protein kinase)